MNASYLYIMSKFLELFDEFTSHVYKIWVLKKGYEPHECVLVYDPSTRQAYIQINIWEVDFKLMEVSTLHYNELFVALMEFLKSKTFLRYKKDSEKFLKKTDDMLLSEYLNENVQETYKGPELEVFVMQLDISPRDY